MEVPPVCDQQLSDEALLERLELLYSKEYIGFVREHLQSLSVIDTDKDAQPSLLAVDFEDVKVSLLVSKQE